MPNNLQCSYQCLSALLRLGGWGGGVIERDEGVHGHVIRSHAVVMDLHVRGILLSGVDAYIMFVPRFVKIKVFACGHVPT